jgi:hypothetical protein
MELWCQKERDHLKDQDVDGRMGSECRFILVFPRLRKWNIALFVYGGDWLLGLVTSLFLDAERHNLCLCLRSSELIDIGGMMEWVLWLSCHVLYLLYQIYFVRLTSCWSKRIISERLAKYRQIRRRLSWSESLGAVYLKETSIQAPFSRCTDQRSLLRWWGVKNRDRRCDELASNRLFLFLFLLLRYIVKNFVSNFSPHLCYVV